MDQTQFALGLMDEPASFYYGVLWNKLYRADIIRAHGVRCNTALSWSEDFLFNLSISAMPSAFSPWMKRCITM